MKKKKLKSISWWNDTLEEMETVYVLNKFTPDSYLQNDILLVYLPAGMSKTKGKQGSIFFVEFAGYLGGTQPFFCTAEEYRAFLYFDKKNSIENLIDNLTCLKKTKEKLTR
jgi:hypothetical protein